MTQQPDGAACHSSNLEPTQNLNVLSTTPLIGPRQLKVELPATPAVNRVVVQTRRTIEAILNGRDPRFLVVVGPCSIHDPQAALDYAQRLVALKRQLEDRLYLVMRVYFEKPRTTIGWKGLINDPHLDGSFDMACGLRLARTIMLQINELGLGTGTEMLDPITPQYLDDLVGWASIGARTTESQTHRQMASGLSMPVGFKNSTDGNLQVAIDAMRSAQHPHHFLGIDEEGRTCIVATRGNRLGHLILRGGAGKPNYHPDSVAQAAAKLQEAGLPPVVMVDCSHANSDKRHERQEAVWNSLIEQRAAGRSPLIGAMLESNLVEGRQDILADRSQLRYGVSITDACIGWEKTQQLLQEGYERLG
ncbi:MAG TPA: 3-deoxy-7-phosphoheptulonate synthase [Phycisphaeraceae bacterium]